MSPQPVDLQGAAAVITGAGSGIGRACAHALAARGTSVVVADIDAGRCETVVAEITGAGGAAVASPCDVAAVADIEAVRARAMDEFGRVDIVMNNVGVLTMGPPEQIPLEEWERVFDLNLMGIVRSNSVFLPGLIAQGHGHVINTASMAGLLPYGYDRLPYVTTKSAIVGMTRSLALYLSPRGVNVTLLCPAGVVTNIGEQMRFFGDSLGALRTPTLPMVEADVVGDLIVDAIDRQRFLVLTAPEAVVDVVRLAEDNDAYLRQSAAAEASAS